mmetsp:Transcript_22365/g.35794  ORF Transcript_22365/g.35794 Transcript_22365/m.35794 type:complete len:256 (+) Transcript_22365:3732-4499(+)
MAVGGGGRQGHGRHGQQHLDVPIARHEHVTRGDHILQHLRKADIHERRRIVGHRSRDCARRCGQGAARGVVHPGLCQTQGKDQAGRLIQHRLDRGQMGHPRLRHLIGMIEPVGLHTRAQRVIKPPVLFPDDRRGRVHFAHQLNQLTRRINVAIARRIQAVAIAPCHPARNAIGDVFGLDHVPAHVVQLAVQMLGKAAARGHDRQARIQRKFGLMQAGHGLRLPFYHRTAPKGPGRLGLVRRDVRTHAASALTKAL